MNKETAPGSISVIIPARNEHAGLSAMLPRLRTVLPHAEVIVVDDGSTDATPAVCREMNVRVLQHPYGMGNGAAIKTGVRAAKGDVLVLMDADGQHSPEDIPRLFARLQEGYDMVVGARTGKSQAGAHRAIANRIYNRLAAWMVNQPIPDLTSGFRIARADRFRRFLYLLPNGFSYPTTITISFFRAGFAVGYLPIVAPPRTGTSHIRLFRDGIRFLLIIFKVGTLYSPLKLFLPISICFVLLGAGHYLYTYLNYQRFTNMGAFLFITSVLVFLIGLVSEQITALHYRDTEKQ